MPRTAAPLKPARVHSPTPTAWNRHHDDPALYTALFKKKFVRVFGLELTSCVSKQKGGHGSGRDTPTNGPYVAAPERNGKSQERKSPCMDCCFERESPQQVILRS
ncbi:hypothetical protein AAVH_34438 [Aphelenchoides avenae]|nr:hypothetical protein AAVH_34438 [Aphelenchus avenae]